MSSTSKAAFTLRQRNWILRLDLPSTLIRHENAGVFRNPQTEGISKKPAIRFRAVDEKILKTELFENDDVNVVM